MTATGTLPLGRRTYEEFAGFWPHQHSNVRFADYMNNTPKLVVSNTPKALEWQNSTLISGDVVQALARLKQQPGKNISINGRGSLVRALLRDNLLDELTTATAHRVRPTLGMRESCDVRIAWQVHVPLSSLGAGRCRRVGGGGGGVGDGGVRVAWRCRLRGPGQ
jgi:hypothetical protein